MVPTTLVVETRLVLNTGHRADSLMRHAMHREARPVCHASGHGTGPAPHAGVAVRRAADCTGVASGTKCFKLHFVQPNFFIFIPKASNIPKSIIFIPKST
ncbi:hypothetical protein HAX54_029153 [Datura stramonium]|uniref:Uncharacterized protein n=1 Tax=Datura stramonium TaxID=4076 RepID=A0ABS8V808_DATST|nr:hypothetical protein [Datura stramonium]